MTLYPHELLINYLHRYYNRGIPARMICVFSFGMLVIFTGVTTFWLLEMPHNPEIVPAVSIGLLGVALSAVFAHISLEMLSHFGEWSRL